jgi:hypothetical protein
VEAAESVKDIKDPFLRVAQFMRALRVAARKRGVI